MTDQHLSAAAVPCWALASAADHAAERAQGRLASAVATRSAVHAAWLDRSAIAHDQPAVVPAAAAAH